MTAISQRDSGFTHEYQIYEPHKTGIPPLKPYLIELWRRRHFLTELSRANMRAQNTRTLFGQFWLVLNPLLLAMVYFIMVDIISARKDGVTFLDQLVAGIFGYYYFSGTITTGSTSVTGSGALIANMSFPRLLMPLSALRTGFFRFLPTLPVFLIIHAATGGTWSWNMLIAVYFFFMLTLFALGLSAVFAALQVYFRDVSSFLPYMLRLWLYLSPVVWAIQDVPHRLKPVMVFNPLFSLLGGWTSLVVHGQIPTSGTFLKAALFGVVMFVAGSLYFMSREGDFAVRL